MRGALVAALGLILLEVVVANRRGADTVSGLFGWVATGADRLLDPNVPAFGKAGSTPAPKTSPPSSGKAPGAQGVPYNPGGGPLQ